jgi:RNA recognition motif-containing protein
MNVVKEINRINSRELDLGINGTEPSSWHAKYKDSAYIFVGNLDYDLTEGDILCVFSQFGVGIFFLLPFFVFLYSLPSSFFLSSFSLRLSRNHATSTL